MERRSFSTYEQDTIRTIVENAGDRADYLLVNAYNDIFFYTNVEFIDNKLHFYYKEGEFHSPKAQDTLLVQKDIIVKTLLLTYLEENRLIYLVEDKNVQNNTSDICSANKDDTQYDLEVDIPEDIATFLSRTKKRVIISEELKALVENDFKTPDDKLLEGINKQISNMALQTIELEGQRQNTIQLVNAANTQTQEVLKQTEKISEQTTLALTQTQEAQRQTEEARKQTEQAILQTKETQLQTQEARKQTSEALKQTNEALKQTNEALEQTKEAQRQTKLNLVVLICSIIALVIAFVTLYIAKLQRDDARDYNEKVAKTQGTIDSTQTQMIKAIDANAYSLKLNTDTIKVQQRETQQNIIKLNKNLKKIQ